MFDSWAWWEVVHATPLGQRLSERYLEAKGIDVLTVDVTLAEIAAKLARTGRPDRIAPALGTIEWGSDILPISVDMAALAAAVQLELRAGDTDASLADALVLAAARLHRAVLISGDPCFAGQPDVRAS